MHYDLIGDVGMILFNLELIDRGVLFSKLHLSHSIAAAARHSGIVSRPKGYRPWANVRVRRHVIGPQSRIIAEACSDLENLPDQGFIRERNADLLRVDRRPVAVRDSLQEGGLNPLVGGHNPLRYALAIEAAGEVVL